MFFPVSRQYYRFPEHKAPPQYITRKLAAEVLGGQEVQEICEKKMHEIVQHWLLWAKTMSAIRVLPFLRIDFLLQRTENTGKMEEANSVKVWTGEVSELGVAVELQGMHSHESRDLVMDAVISSMVSRPWSGHNDKEWSPTPVGNTWEGCIANDLEVDFHWKMGAFLAVAEV